MGEHREALTTVRETVALYRELAAAEPARHTADLAQSLNNLGASLRDVGEYREALTTHREAVALRRELAAAEPARHTADLAITLGNFGVLLREVGDEREGLSAAAETVAWWGRLNRLRPAEYTEQYKAAQRDLARQFSEAGRPPGAAMLAEREAARHVPADDAPHIAN